MKKMTFNEVKEEAQKFFKEHRDICMFALGVGAEVAASCIFEQFCGADHVHVRYDVTNGEKAIYSINHVDKFGKEREVSHFYSKPKDAIYMAREILYHLAGE